MSEMAPALHRLPMELLQHIATFCDEKSVWRMRATCRATRAGGELALRPFLKIQSVIAQPPLIPNIYVPIHIKYAPIISARRDPVRPFVLEQRSNFFQTHLSNHPPSVAHLRDLTVEIIDSEYGSGWRYVIEFAPQLTHLSLHVFDAQWCVEYANTPRPFHPHVNPRHIHGLLIDNIWPSVFRDGQILFPNLTHLTLAVTARIFSHLAQIVSCVPDLQELTLSCHENILGDVRRVLEDHRLDHLVRLNVTGHLKVVQAVLDVILGLSASIRYLSIHLSTQKFATPIQTLLDLGPACEHLPLLGLALLGPHAIGMIRALQERQSTFINFTFLPNLKVLVFERPNFYNPYTPDKNGYPLLSDHRLDLPALQRIVIVDLPFCRLSLWGPWSRAPKRAKEIVVNNLFKPYPCFRQIQRVTAYAVNPFAVDQDTDGEVVMFQDDDPMLG